MLRFFLPALVGQAVPHPVAFPCSCSRNPSLSLRRVPAAMTEPSCCPAAFPCPPNGTGKGGVGPSLTLETQASRWLPGLLATVVVLSSFPPAVLPEEDATLADVPQTLSGGGGEVRKRIQRPKSRQAETCTVKCVGTCIRGGAGSPGEGPFNVRRPLVVFKPGFRSRNYCLVECSDICNLIKDGDDGP